jgi:tetratricopeptide (TPR) repeat protein
MYLPRSSKWSMNRRRKRPNYFSWTVLLLVLLFGYYFNQIYLPSQPNPFEATPTAARSPESLATEAKELFKNGKLFQAIEAYEQAIKSSPQDPTLYIELARVQVFAGRPAEAQANAENALLLNPTNSMAHAVQAWALDFQPGADNNADAMSAIQKAIELDPNNALAHAYYVEILVDSGSFDNYAKAAEESRVALALDPNLLETHRARAYIYEATGSEGNNYELAIQEYQAAIDINPNIPMLYIELGRNYRVLQVYDKAIDAFTRANTLNPEDPEPDLFLSRTYATIGEYAKALQYAETAVKDSPLDASVHGNYGVMLYRNLFWSDAANELSLATKGGRTEDGFEIAGIPLVNEARVAEYYFTYGLALARTNQCGEALQIAQALQTRVPSDENAIFAASEIIRICQENLDNPAVATPTPGADEQPTETETPALTPTPAQ